MSETDAPAQQADSREPIVSAAPQSHGLSTRAAVAAASTLLGACGGGSDGDASSSAALPAASAYQYTAAASDADAARFLQQAQFGSTLAEISGLRGGRYAEWLGAQFASPQGPTGWDWLQARGYGATNNNFSFYFSHYPADFMIWSQLLSGPVAMRRRMALALSEFFVVSLTAAEFTWRSHAVAHYWDTLVRHAFGNFRQLLEDVSLHPTMGYFLNTKGNQKENSKGRVPDENYAREVMQLFTIGLYQLNLDGTEKTDANGQRIESYTQSDVSNLARVFTGYDFDTSDNAKIPVPGASWTIDSYEYARKPMALDATRHSTLEATFLGTTVTADTPAADALTTALDTLFNHPNVGPFFARQMIQRLVTSQPSPAYVARVATAFNNNGSGVRGDLRAVWAAILLDDEARGPQGLASTSHGKLREPMLRFIQWARTFGATSAAGSWKIFELNNAANQLGQSPLRAPSVFNFFRPGYVPPATELAVAKATAPEFQLVNETTVGGYLNYMQRIIRDGISCPTPHLPEADFSTSAVDVKAAYTAELALATDAPALVRHLSLVMCAGQLSAATQTTIVGALNAMAATADDGTPNLNRIAAAVLMVMASAEYLVQK